MHRYIILKGLPCVEAELFVRVVVFLISLVVNLEMSEVHPSMTGM